MKLKLTNQQKQYLMYFAIFVLGYLMCMYYPVHNRNNNVPMPILEGFNAGEFDIAHDFYSIQVEGENGGSHNFSPEFCMMDFQELLNGDSCNQQLTSFIERYPGQDISIRKSGDSTKSGISISRDELFNFIESEKVCTHRYDVSGFPDGLSLCAEKGAEKDHPCGPDFDEKCEKNDTPTSGANRRRGNRR